MLIGGLIYPLAGNWIWGGGWLANLGLNLGLGHGYVDVAGAGLVHLLGAAAALAGILVFLPRRPRSAAPGEAPLPATRWPLLALLGAVALLIGSFAWTVANPLLPRDTLDLSLLALNGILAAAAGALAALAYTWLVAGTPDPLMAARGLAAGARRHRGLRAVRAALGCAGGRRRGRAVDPPGDLHRGSPAALG